MRAHDPDGRAHRPRAIQLSPHEVEKVTQLVLSSTGNDFSDKGTLVSAKVGALCASAGYAHFWELWDALQQPSIASAQLRQRLIDVLTTNYSYFYREPAHFEYLARLVAAGELPAGTDPAGPVTLGGIGAGTGGMRVWSAGCATGEEAYNLAMVMEDACRAGTLRTGYEVVGSDVSSRALATAEAARYDVANVARMPPHWRNLYCVRDGQGYTITAPLRRCVTFRCESVLSPRVDAPFDVVMCRNMLIYFDQPSIERFLAVARGRMRVGGYLLLGHTEIMGRIEGFTYIAPSIWRRDA